MYLPTIMQNGQTLLIEAENITNVQLMQPLNIGSDKVCYIVVISYKDGMREQAVITDEVWKWWNSDERRNHGESNNQQG